MRKQRKLVSILLSLIMFFSLFTIIPTTVAGATVTVRYIDLDGNTGIIQLVRELEYSTNLDSSGGWYAVTANREFNSRMTVTGNVNIVLFNNVTLTAHKGISVTGDNSLTIWQYEPEEGAATGRLVVDQTDEGNAGIGSEWNGSGGSVIINGGTINATGGTFGAGIGGGFYASGASVMINRGTVTAAGGNSGVGIGGGNNSAVTINGGTVSATGTQGSSTGIAGIGDGHACSGGTITLDGTNEALRPLSVTSNGYKGTVNLAMPYKDDSGAVYPAGIVSDNSALADKTLVPALFTITWKDSDGTVLETDKNVPYGTTPSYDGETPSKSSDDDFSYFFAGWTPEVTTVVADAVYTAQIAAVPWTVPYIDLNGDEQRLMPNNYTAITSGTTELSSDWYVVRENISTWTRLNVSGNVSLILCNGTTFYAHKGINVNEYNTLTIYGQTEDGTLESGKLIIDSPDMYYAGIGSGKNASAGTINIAGGIINAQGGIQAAGIGGGYYGNGGTVNISGGTVNAQGSYGAAGIGGGKNCSCGTVNISGGTITATGGKTGIGSGTDDAIELGKCTLTWTEESKNTMSVYTSGCNVNATLENPFMDGDGTLYTAGTYGGWTIAGKTLTPALFDITWVNYDGRVLETDLEVKGNVTPTYDGDTPVKPTDENYRYVFSGWTPEVVPAVADATYTATFEAIDKFFPGHSLTLDGDIGINFFVELNDAQLASGAVVDFSWTVNGVEKTHSVTLTAADKTANGYKATCPVAVAEMTYEVTATLSLNGEPCSTDTYSVKQYADTILSDDYKTKYLAADHTEEEYNKLATLIKSMLIYGAKAQIWFDRNLDDLADKGLDYTLTEVTPEMISPSARDMESGLDAYGLKYEGSTIVYLSKTSLRHYYTITDQAKFDLVKDSVMFDGEPVEYSTKDGKIYFEVTNIGAADLDTPYPLQIGTNIYSYTVLDYVRECIKGKYTPYQTMLLVFATYWYSQASNAYFGR